MNLRKGWRCKPTRTKTF